MSCPTNDCFAKDAESCGHGPIFTTGADGRQIVTVCSDYTIDRGIDQIDVTAPGVTLTAPKNPNPGDVFEVNALAGPVTLKGSPCQKGPICGGGSTDQVQIASCTLGRFNFTTACRWVGNFQAPSVS